MKYHPIIKAIANVSVCANKASKQVSWKVSFSRLIKFQQRLFIYVREIFVHVVYYRLLIFRHTKYDATRMILTLGS